MKKFYLTGHNSFGNRGCEAIVRSTVTLLREQFGDIEVLVPSKDIPRDQAQWPQASQYGVRFVPVFGPPYTRYWVHLQRFPIPVLKRAGWPFPLPKDLCKTISEMDAVLSVGGDNYSLDYRLPSLLMGLDSFAINAGVPVVLWGASVGPFEREPHFVPKIREHLSRFSLIAARESVTMDYLHRNLDLHNSILVSDPAFALNPEPVKISCFWPVADGNGVLGLNVSPLLQRYRPPGENVNTLLNEVAGFVRHVVENMGMGVLLVPHVVPLEGVKKNNDAEYMQGILDRTGDMGGRVQMMDYRFNAAQIKYVISQCKFFIGARTHSTIAAFSSGVPTISIAYSIKAKGINMDLFGHTDYVLETNKISALNLKKILERLLVNNDEVHNVLSVKKEEWRQRAVIPANLLNKLLN